MGINNTDDLKCIKKLESKKTGEKYMETERLLIRNFVKEDAYACFDSWGKDKELGKYIPLYPMKTLQQMQDFLKYLVINENAWIIIDQKLNEVVGYITVDIPYEQLQIGEIGYVIGEKYQKQGYAYEAVHCVLNEYLSKKNLYMIEAKYNETNNASAKLLQKLGFHLDGNLRDRRIDPETKRRNNLIICSVTQSEFCI